MELTLMHDLMHGTMRWMAELPQMAASSLVSSVWQGVVLAAGVGICLRLMPKTTAAVRSAAWTAVFAVLAMLPFLHGFAHSGPATSARGAMLQVDVRWSYAIAGMWLALSLFRAGRLALSAFRLRAIWKRATPVDAGKACAALLADAGWRRVQICTSGDVGSPSVIGFFSPRILIPAGLFESLTAVELEQIVLHEMGHLRRGDDWINMLQKLGLVLFPLNPVLLWIERRLCFERELACDDDVLRVTRAPKAYARCLTSLAERRLDQRIASLSLGAWERKSELSRRVHRILLRGEGMSRTQARVALSVLVLALLGGATEVSRCPRIVSFAASPETAQVTPSEVQVSPVAQYHPVVSPMQSAAHETLLWASMPANNTVKAVAPVAHARNRHASAPVLKRAKERSRKQQTQRLVVLTSWVERGESGAPTISNAVLTVVGERSFFSSYAAQSADGGWLLIQL